MSTSQPLEIATLDRLRATLDAARVSGKSIGLVPTLGYLHAGHRALMQGARAENDIVVVSIYVNPTQFGPSEDLDRYPRDLARDRAIASEEGVDILFVPAEQTMYPDGPQGQAIWVEPGTLARHLCGAKRPGHFRGVATVVAKLFNMVGPHRAYFGAKDAQQAIIIARMVRDLAFPIDIRIVPTVREDDGLALSSRNVYLLPLERAQAPALKRALDVATRLAAAGVHAGAIENAVRTAIEREAPLAVIDYVTVVDRETLQPVDGPIHGEVVVAVAVYFGRTRLIDNVVIGGAGEVPS